MSKSQVATEYLVVIAVGIAILVPLITYLNELFLAYKDDSKIASAKNAVNKLATLSNWVHSQGYPARVTCLIYLPEGVESIEFLNKTITIRMKTKSGFVDISEGTLTEIYGSLPEKEGYYNVVIKHEHDRVRISVIE